VKSNIAEAVSGPVEEAVQVIGGKWKLLVLRSFLLNGPRRYNELLGTVTAISQPTSQYDSRLQLIGHAGITRHYNYNRPKYEQMEKTVAA
jgi:DNA-binding HxlR family transcriptional regulator